MRAAGGYIDQLWQRGGPFVGPEGRPHGRVTIQLPWDDVLDFPEWIVRPTTENIGTYVKRGSPLRFFQKADNSQVEIELPGVTSIDIDRSLDNGAGTCHFSVLNQKMDPPGTASSESEIGQPGYYTFDHGSEPVARARWGHLQNPFFGLLLPNTIVRTFQGYGGNDKSIGEALDDGNLLLTGVWIIDKVTISADARLEVECRDTMKLLIEQLIYPPPIPRGGDIKYPLTYRRWILELGPVKASEKTITHVAPGDKNTSYRNSSSDMWLGTNADVHGHRPTESLDGNPGTYWLSEGNSNPGRPFCTSWIEYDCGEDINAVYLSPWAGQYQLFVSIMEHGEWLGTESVAYDYHPLIGHQPTVVDTGANIPYVFTAGVPWETPQVFQLDRAYRADRVRLSFRNHTRSDFGPWYYRVGIREAKLRVVGDGTVATSSPLLICGAAPVRAQVGGPPSVAGYWTVSDNDQIDCFGDAVDLPTDSLPGSDLTNTIKSHPDGKGYWTLQNDGYVRAFGTAVHHGDFRTLGIHPTDDRHRDVAFELAPTFTGDGYWITRNDGRIYAFGDAEDYVSSIILPGEFQLGTAEGHPSAMGLWLCDQTGHVYAYGACAHLGNATLPGKVTALRSTSTGDGYWVMSVDSSVQAFGDAWVWPDPQAFDLPTNWAETYWELIPAVDDQGYGVLRGNGEIFPRGTFQWFGGPIPGTQAMHRKPGNYLDYADIIKDLALWAGFLFYETVAPNEEPSVYGSIESTGAYSDEDLPIDMFDKKPIIDVMNQIKEIVAYQLYVDDDGSLIFTSPNWWAPGNFDESGHRISQIPEIDELRQLLSYSVSIDDESLVSEVLISSEDPDQGELTTISARLVPPTAKGLRGISKPFMWINGHFQKKEEMDLMAELVALHIWFQQRIGNVSCAANPCIQINDQVRIWERITGDTYIHYLRGVSTHMDLLSGDYTMSLTTHWLGDTNNWAIGNYKPTVIDDSTFPGEPILVASPSFGITDTTWAFVSRNQDKAADVTIGQEPLVVTTMAEGEPSDEEGSAHS